MHRWIRGVSRFIPNSSESNSPIILFSSFHRSNPIEVDKLKPLAATFPILHRTYTQQNTSSPRRSRTPPAYGDFVHVVKTGGGIGVSVYKRKLPKKLAQRVVKLTCESTAKGGVCDVYVVGTNHISPKSRQEVQAVINVLKPQVVYLELCSSRVGFLTQNLEILHFTQLLNMHRWIRGVSRLIPNSSKSNSPITLSSSFYSNKTPFHRSNPIKFDKLKPLAAAFPILHRNYTKKNTSSRTLPTYGAYDDLVQVVRTAKDDGGIGASVYKRKKLPEGLAKDVVKLTCESKAKGGICDVYVIGTRHRSTKSCQEVQAVISFLKPQVVFLELCSSRISVLNLKASEFRMGFDEAMKYGGKVILGDRPYKIMIRRTWARLPLWHKTKLITSSVFLRAFSSSRLEIINIIELNLKQYPTILETYIHERDKYMSYALLRVASEHNSVVAVVGKMHLDGIRKHWKEPIEQQHIRDLLEMPVSKPGVIEKKILKFFGVAE